MKSAKVFALPFSLLCLFSAANAAEWDDCLVRAYVPAKNGEGESPARVASFVPRDSRVWGEPRLRAWRKRVASLLSGSDAAAGESLTEDDVLVREAGSPVDVLVDRCGLSLPPELLDAVKSAVEVVSFDAGGGESVVRTNRYAFSSAPSGVSRRFSVTLGPEASSTAVALLPARLAGHSIWLLSWDELDARWTKMLGADPERVRAEVSAVEDCLRHRESRFGGGEAWRRRIAAWLADGAHRAIWPRVVFENRCSRHVRVDFGTRSRIVRRGEAWTNEVPSVPTDKMSWSFVPVNSDGRPQSKGDFDYSDDAAFLIDWSPDGRGDVVKTIHDQLLRPKPAPRLNVDHSFLPSETIRRSLAPGELLVSVKYADASEPTPVPVNDIGGNAMRWVELEPHRKIERIFVEEGTYWKRTALRPEKETYARGETVRAEHPVELKPWPALVLASGADDRAVTNALEAIDASGRAVPSVFDPNPVVLAPGRSQRIENAASRFVSRAGGATSDSAPLRFSVRVVSTAAYADAVTNEFEFARGAGEDGSLVVECRPVLHEIPPPPEPEKLPWLPADRRAKNSPVRLFMSLDKRIKREMPFDRESDAAFREEVARLAYAVPDAPVTDESPAVAILRKHLADCTDPQCPDCAPFRARNVAWLPQDGSAPDDAGALVVLYHDFLLSNPRYAGESGPEDATAALLRRMTPRNR